MPILKMVEEERFLMDIIRTRQKNWIGPILIGNSLQRKILERRMEGREEEEGLNKSSWAG